MRQFCGKFQGVGVKFFADFSNAGNVGQTSNDRRIERFAAGGVRKTLWRY